jgi:hypothetical protein
MPRGPVRLGFVQTRPPSRSLSRGRAASIASCAARRIRRWRQRLAGNRPSHNLGLRRSRDVDFGHGFSTLLAALAAGEMWHASDRAREDRQLSHWTAMAPPHVFGEARPQRLPARCQVFGGGRQRGAGVINYARRLIVASIRAEETSRTWLGILQRRRMAGSPWARWFGVCLALALLALAGSEALAITRIR